MRKLLFDLYIPDSNKYMLIYTVLPIPQYHLYLPYRFTNTIPHTPPSPLHELSPPSRSLRLIIRPPLLINLHPINQPIRLRKRTRQQLRMRITRRRRTRTITRPPHILRARPLPTQRGIKHDIHIREMLIDVAVTREMSHGRAPVAGVGNSGRDVCGDGGAGEEVDVDVLGGPFCGVDAAADGVEAGTERLLVRAQDGAAGVFLLVGGVGVAVCGVDFRVG